MILSVGLFKHRLAVLEYDELQADVELAAEILRKAPVDDRYPVDSPAFQEFVGAVDELAEMAGELARLPKVKGVLGKVITSDERRFAHSGLMDKAHEVIDLQTRLIALDKPAADRLAKNTEFAKRRRKSEVARQEKLDERNAALLAVANSKHVSRLVSGAYPKGSYIHEHWDEFPELEGFTRISAKTIGNVLADAKVK